MIADRIHNNDNVKSIQKNTLSFYDDNFTSLLLG